MLRCAPGSFADKVVESFSGPHDWLNSSHYYGADGNIAYATGLWGSEVWDKVDVLLAAPMGLSTLCTQLPSVCNSALNAYNMHNNTIPAFLSQQHTVVTAPPTIPMEGSATAQNSGGQP